MGWQGDAPEEQRVARDCHPNLETALKDKARRLQLIGAAYAGSGAVE